MSSLQQQPPIDEAVDNEEGVTEKFEQLKFEDEPEMSDQGNEEMKSEMSVAH